MEVEVAMLGSPNKPYDFCGRKVVVEQTELSCGPEDYLTCVAFTSCPCAYFDLIISLHAQKGEGLQGCRWGWGHVGGGRVGIQLDNTLT